MLGSRPSQQQHTSSSDSASGSLSMGLGRPITRGLLSHAYSARASSALDSTCRSCPCQSGTAPSTETLQA